MKSLADHDDEDLQMALRMSLQHAPDPKRSKPREIALVADTEESSEARIRRLQRETLAAAAEKRITMGRSVASGSAQQVSGSVSPARSSVLGTPEKIAAVAKPPAGGGEGEELPPEEAERLFSLVFGEGASKDIIEHWCNQGVRFSTDPETSMGLVQHEGGPCGVLAPIQAFVLKYLLFCTDELSSSRFNMQTRSSVLRKLSQRSCTPMEYFCSLTEGEKTRALILSMVEILFSCGSQKKAIVATLSVLKHYCGEKSEESDKSEVIAKALEGLSIGSSSGLQNFLRIHVHTSQTAAFNQIKAMLPVFQSRMGALLFLFSVLLSRGLENIQADRDDPSLPLVTAPFGHASQQGKESTLG